MDSIKSQLIDMGFNEAKVYNSLLISKRAIDSCPEAQTLEQVMEWLIAHEDEINENKESSASKPEVSQAVAKQESEKPGTKEQKAESNLDETAVNMAARKKITVEEAQRLITERQARRAEEERKKEIEDEKRRRLDGQKMAETRAELQDQERIRLAQQIRKEKLEKELYKKQLLEQIARDREAMRLRNQPKPSSEPATLATPANPSNPSTDSASKNIPQSPAIECKIALRFPDGTSLIQKFSPQEQLSAVRLFVQLQKKSVHQIEFVAPPNNKLTESMMDNTLESLGLCPASRLEVKYKQAEWSDMD